MNRGPEGVAEMEAPGVLLWKKPARKEYKTDPLGVYDIEGMVAVDRAG